MSKQVRQIILLAELYHSLIDSIIKVKALSILKTYYYKIIKISEYKKSKHKTRKYNTTK